MPPRKAADAAPDAIAEIAKVVQRAYQDGYAAAEKAFADVAAASRGTNDKVQESLKGTGDALIAAYKRIGDLETRNFELIKLLDGLSAVHKQKEYIDAQKEIAKMQNEIEEKKIAADAGWKTEAIRTLGPKAGPLFELAAAWLGGGKIPTDPRRGDGTTEGDGKAACVRALLAIGADPDLVARNRAVVGEPDWSMMIDYFMGQSAGAPAQDTATQPN